MLSNNIYIVGLMGSGKTSIGKLLSKTLHSEHVDIDQEKMLLNMLRKLKKILMKAALKATTLDFLIYSITKEN